MSPEHACFFPILPSTIFAQLDTGPRSGETLFWTGLFYFF